MAKALLGAVSSIDPRVTERILRDNRALRARVVDLEAMVIRLQAENDALAAMVSEATADVLEPA